MLDGPDIFCDGGIGRRDCELEDVGLIARVVHNEHVGDAAARTRREDVESQRMEVFASGEALERHLQHVGHLAICAHICDPEGAARVGVEQRPHDCVPVLAVGVAAGDDPALEEFFVVCTCLRFTDNIPEPDVLAGIESAQRVVDGAA